MIIEIQDKTHVFLAGRRQHVVVIENKSVETFQRLLTPLRKIYFCCLLYVRIKRSFPLISLYYITCIILLVSKSLISENSDVSSPNILHIDFKPSGTSFI